MIICSVILYREQVSFRKYDDVCFELDQHTKLDSIVLIHRNKYVDYVGKNVAPLGHVLISNQPAFAVTR